jgi:nitroreductase/dihydropteridine reductase
MNIANLAQTRYTTKAFDPQRKIPEAAIEELRTLLHNSPSSVNSQPWHFFIAASDAGKARIAKATQPGYPFNEAKIRNASHVIVMCSRTDLDAEHLATLLAQEEHDGRLPTAEAKAMQDKTRNFYVNQHRFDRKDLQPWMEKQVFIALGTLLLGAAALEIDACPMEGFDARILDEELGLREKGLTSLLIVGLGYRSADDFNAKLPKSRLPAQSIFTTL